MTLTTANSNLTSQESSAETSASVAAAVIISGLATAVYVGVKVNRVLKARTKAKVKSSLHVHFNKDLFQVLNPDDESDSVSTGSVSENLSFTSLEEKTEGSLSPQKDVIMSSLTLAKESERIVTLERENDDLHFNLEQATDQIKGLERALDKQERIRSKMEKTLTEKFEKDLLYFKKREETLKASFEAEISKLKNELSEERRDQNGGGKSSIELLREALRVKEVEVANKLSELQKDQIGLNQVMASLEKEGEKLEYEIMKFEKEKDEFLKEKALFMEKSARYKQGLLRLKRRETDLKKRIMEIDGVEEGDKKLVKSNNSLSDKTKKPNNNTRVDVGSMLQLVGSILTS